MAAGAGGSHDGVTAEHGEPRAEKGPRAAAQAGAGGLRRGGRAVRLGAAALAAHALRAGARHPAHLGLTHLALRAHHRDGRPGASPASVDGKVLPSAGKICNQKAVMGRRPGFVHVLSMTLDRFSAAYVSMTMPSFCSALQCLNVSHAQILGKVNLSLAGLHSDLLLLSPHSSHRRRLDRRQISQRAPVL